MLLKTVWHRRAEHRMVRYHHHIRYDSRIYASTSPVQKKTELNRITYLRFQFLVCHIVCRNSSGNLINLLNDTPLLIHGRYWH